MKGARAIREQIWREAEIENPKFHWNYRIYRYGYEQGGGLELHNFYYEHGKRTKYFQINFEG